MEKLNLARAKKLLKKAGASNAVISSEEVSVASVWAMLQFITQYRKEVNTIVELGIDDIEPLVGLCENNAQRYVVLWLIDRSGFDGGVNFAAEQLKAGSSTLVKMAVNALASIGSDAARDALEAFCGDHEDDDSVTAELAREALTTFSYENIPERIREQLSTTPKLALKALGNIRDPEATSLLLAHLPSKQNDCRLAAIEGLKSRPEREVFDELAFLTLNGTAASRLDALQLLSGYSSDQAALAVCAVMRNGRSVAIRKDAALALGRMGNPIIIESLLACIASSEEKADVVAGACLSLKKLGCVEAVEPLIELVNNTAHGDGNIKLLRSFNLYALATEVLHSLCPKTEAAPFDQLVHHNDVYVRLAAVHALRQRKLPESYAALASQREVEKDSTVAGELDKSLKTLAKYKT